MLYELRIYHIYPGRMEAIHERFSEHTLKLFEKHGMRTVDFWEDADGANKLYYILEHNDRDTRDISFTHFMNDPDRIEVKGLSELDGPIVEKIDNFFMERVLYSPVNG